MNLGSIILWIITTTLITFSVSCKNSSVEENNNRSKDTISKRSFQLSDLKKLNVLHTKMGEPKWGDWLDYKDEPGQSFNQYINSNPVKPTKKRKKIYILPIGDFYDIDSFVINETAEFMQIFLSLEVIIQKNISADIIPDTSKRYNYDILQLHTKYILRNILLKQIPDDAMAYIAITSNDLYPADDWNFVFGQASTKKRVGVSSIYRLKYEGLDSTNYQLFLKRIAKTTTHETCHMFSMKHCIHYKCLINGAMHQEEADSKPMYLCSDCLAKLMWCSNKGIINRFNLMEEFFNKHGYASESKYCVDAKKILSELQ